MAVPVLLRRPPPPPSLGQEAADAAKRRRVVATELPLLESRKRKLASELFSLQDTSSGSDSESTRSSSQASQATVAATRKRGHQDLPFNELNNSGARVARRAEEQRAPRTISRSTEASSVEDIHNNRPYRASAPLRPVNHNASFERLERFAVSTYRSYTKGLAELARTKDESYGNPKHETNGLDGDARFKRIKRDLMGFGENNPIELQVKMHQHAFSVEGPLIWREEYFANTKMILDREKWEARLSILFILTQRKMGKTYFLGQHAVIHAMNPPIADFRIACISKTLDQAILTVAIARKLFATHARRGEFQLEVNQVRRIAITKDGYTSEIRAYSGNPDVHTHLPCWRSHWLAGRA